VASTEGVYRIGSEMQHFQDIDALQLPASALTIGSFDGVHLGHQALIRQMVAAAEEIKIPSVVVTFYPHPSVVLGGRRPSFYITSPDEKAARLGELGVDYIVTQEFNSSLSLMRASDFLKWLKDQLKFQMLWVGENFALGYRREGDVGFLEEISEEYDFELHVVAPIFVDGEIISSTRVREALRSGDVDRVARYLGQPFILRGTVVSGVGRGKRLGIPTANLMIWEEMAFPAPGVYACIANLNGEAYPSVVNIGVRPTFKDDLDAPLIEAHLVGFNGDLYDKELELRFIQRLRKEQRFNDPEDLIGQIQKDIERAIEILS
jgi:riboflavin kinase/FMN adenylyltransferase